MPGLWGKHRKCGNPAQGQEGNPNELNAEQGRRERRTRTRGLGEETLMLPAAAPQPGFARGCAQAVRRRGIFYI